MKRVWIWGCGCFGKIALKVLKADHSWNIQGVIDNDAQKKNMFLDGYQIKSFEEQKEMIRNEDIIVCCCTRDNYEIFKTYLKENGYKKYIYLEELDMKEILFQQVKEGDTRRLVSRCCTQRDFFSSSFIRIAEEMHLPSGIHRKFWEFVYIVQTLESYQVVKEGKSGIGFAVGLEPLPSYFASKKVNILATDLSLSIDSAKAWVVTGQNAGGNLEKLYKEEICEKDIFRKYVQYQDVDMNYLPDNLGKFDFCWSSCAIEHVGSLEQSKEFLKNMINVLKPGGVAVHTTEFNLISNDDTVEKGNSVIFRRKDVIEMQEWFKANGHHMEISFDRGCDEGDLYVGIPPFRSQPYHLNIMLDEYIATSFAIVVQKAE